MNPPSFGLPIKILLEAFSTLATLYNTGLPGGNCFLFFFLIVFIRALPRRVENRSVVWIAATYSL
jgi:hypothetical protein